MCGIAGYCLNNSQQFSAKFTDSLLQSIGKRGPDDEGICLISREGKTHQFYRNDRTHKSLGALPHIKTGNGIRHDIAFLHTRYAILDLSEKGHQPFISSDGSTIAVFNGEIYNYVELQDELSSLGVKFHTRSDTEVLVEGYARWKEALWPKMNGFWAVVLYDCRDQSIIFSRDRIGVAPLYYRETSSGIFFSSCIEPLIDIDGQKASVSKDAVSGFLQTGFKDIEGSTFYREIKTVPAARTVHLLRSQSLLAQGKHSRFWHLPVSLLSENDISFEDAVKTFRDIFFNAVDIRLRADVKVAFELSGGLDSSSVVAAASCLSKEPVSTYTVKIKDADEEPYARSILKKYKLDYHVLSKIENSFTENYGAFAQLMEEPYDNPNNYTHYRMLQSMLAQGVKVIVTGAGGDEVFAGYESSFWPKAYQERRRQGFRGLLQADWYEFCRRFKTPQNTYTTLKHYLTDPWVRIVGNREQIKPRFPQGDIPSALQYQNLYDSLSFHKQREFHFLIALLPYYMRSSDHYTMGIPIEHRFPLLDYRIIEFGMQLPISYLFRNGFTKYILRKAMEPYLPDKIIWRRQKMGFQFPYRQYFLAHRQTFEPILNKFCGDRNYMELAKNDPVLLWRFLSTAIWTQYFPKGRDE
ncbi:MAG: asparagine synthase (glutamine-hydrolyzing) [Candidatus Omnitrophica bacterium]|nr:asparagine synthase (glutamine-hydrolyzing) [Candidatus Omnitrophota bacterium]